MGASILEGMEISFADKKLGKIIDDWGSLQRKYGDVQAKKIIQRLSELVASKNLYDIFKLPQTRLHKLDHNWNGHFAVDIKQPYRIILKPLDGNPDDIQTITKASIIKIVDYH